MAGQVPVLHTTDASIGEVIEPASIQNLPLNGRMLIDLVLTVPGAHVSHGAQAGDMNPLYWRPGQRSAVSIGGNRPNANYFLLDGTTNTDPTFNTLNLSPSPDAVQEFKVQTGNYSAEMGGAGGGQVNIVTRSGTESSMERFTSSCATTRSTPARSTKWIRLIIWCRTISAFPWVVLLRKTHVLLYQLRRITARQIRHYDRHRAYRARAQGDFSESGATIYNPFNACPTRTTIHPGP